MTIYSHLPVYKASYDLALGIFKTVKEFNREYKYTLGENMKKEAIEMVTDIYRANSSYSKKPHIEKAREKIETIRMFFRLARDLRQVRLKSVERRREELNSHFKPQVWLGTSSRAKYFPIIYFI